MAKWVEFSVKGKRNSATRTTGKKVPVTERALIQRINRVLAKEDRQLLTGRTPRVVLDLGRYYVVDTDGARGCVYSHVDLEGFARELNVIAGYETLADEDEQ